MQASGDSTSPKRQSLGERAITDVFSNANDQVFSPISRAQNDVFALVLSS